jgi:tripartite-type tricarboxylate transporter receptor subunit TctC
MRRLRSKTRLAGHAVAALAAAILWTAGTDAAAQFPERDITFIVPDPPGGGFDTYVRVIAPFLERALSQKVNVIPTNIAGAAGTKGATAIFRAKPDGYTIGIFNMPGILVQQMLGHASGFDLYKISWIASFGSDPYMLSVPARSPYRSIAALKAIGRPVKITTTGPGSTSYVAMHIAASLLGLAIEPLTGYRGSYDYVLGAIRGDGDATVTALPVLRKYLSAGDIRLLVAFEQHASAPAADDASSLGIPELAAIKVERLIGGPPGMPAEIVKLLSDALTKAMRDPETARQAAAADIAFVPQDAGAAREILYNQAKFLDRFRSLLGAAE